MPTLRIPGPGEAALAQSVAHELNNIAASLLGFVELAAAGASEDSPLQGPLGELRIGVRRIVGLAGLLAGLGETDAAPDTVPIVECIAEPDRSGAAATARIAWGCDPATPVIADAARIRAALQVLGDLATAGAAAVAAAPIAIARGGAAASRCRVCGAPNPADLIRVTIGDGGLRGAVGERVRRGAGTALSRIAMTAGTHLAHLGGAHVDVDAVTGTLALLLRPAAATPSPKPVRPRRTTATRNRRRTAK